MKKSIHYPMKRKFLVIAVILIFFAVLASAAPAGCNGVISGSTLTITTPHSRTITLYGVSKYGFTSAGVWAQRGTTSFYHYNCQVDNGEWEIEGDSIGQISTMQDGGYGVFYYAGKFSIIASNRHYYYPYIPYEWSEAQWGNESVGTPIQAAYSGGIVAIVSSGRIYNRNIGTTTGNETYISGTVLSDGIHISSGRLSVVTTSKHYFFPYDPGFGDPTWGNETLSGTAQQTASASGTLAIITTYKLYNRTIGTNTGNETTISGTVLSNGVHISSGRLSVVTTNRHYYFPHDTGYFGPEWGSETLTGTAQQTASASGTLAIITTSKLYNRNIGTTTGTDVSISGTVLPNGIHISSGRLSVVTTNRHYYFPYTPPYGDPTWTSQILSGTAIGTAETSNRMIIGTTTSLYKGYIGTELESQGISGTALNVYGCGNVMYLVTSSRIYAVENGTTYEEPFNSIHSFICSNYLKAYNSHQTIDYRSYDSWTRLNISNITDVLCGGGCDTCGFPSPSATITSPLNGASFDAGETITLSGTGSGNPFWITSSLIELGTEFSETTSFTTPGTYEINLITTNPCGAQARDTVTITIDTPALPAVSCSVTPSTANVVANNNAGFSVSCADSTGTVAPCPSISWTTNAGTLLAASGLSTTLRAQSAPATGKYVRASAGSFNCQSTVTITEDPTPVSCEVSPSTANVLVNSSSSFTATCENSIGHSVSCPSIAWTTNVGSVSSSSPTSTNFIAQSTAGTGRVRAETGSFNCQSNVTVQATPPELDSVCTNISFFNNTCSTLVDPNNLSPATGICAKITMQNTGTRTWFETSSSCEFIALGQHHRVGIDNPHDNSVYGSTRKCLLTSETIATGASKEFTIIFNTMTDPSHSAYDSFCSYDSGTGRYECDFDWKMLSEEETWFGGNCPIRKIKINTPVAGYCKLLGPGAMLDTAPPANITASCYTDSSETLQTNCPAMNWSATLGTMNPVSTSTSLNPVSQFDPPSTGNTAQITANAGSFSCSTSINVTPAIPPAVSCTLSPSTASVLTTISPSVTLTVTCRDLPGAVTNCPMLNWDVDDTLLGDVSTSSTSAAVPSNIFTASSDGTATVTAQNGFSCISEITISSLTPSCTANSIPDISVDGEVSDAGVSYDGFVNVPNMMTIDCGSSAASASTPSPPCTSGGAFNGTCSFDCGPYEIQGSYPINIILQSSSGETASCSTGVQVNASGIFIKKIEATPYNINENESVTINVTIENTYNDSKNITSLIEIEKTTPNTETIGTCTSTENIAGKGEHTFTCKISNTGSDDIIYNLLRGIYQASANPTSATGEPITPKSEYFTVGKSEANSRVTAPDINLLLIPIMLLIIIGIIRKK